MAMMFKHYRTFLAVFAALVVGGTVFAGSAGARSWNPQYQAHLGACGKTTLSIPLAVSRWHHLGVDTKFAHDLGLQGVNGNIDDQLKGELVMGKVVKATLIIDHGCRPGGRVFALKHLVALRKGALVASVPPASIDACNGPHKGCRLGPKAGRRVVFLHYCFNEAGHYKVLIVVQYWVPVHVQPKQPVAQPAPSCNGVMIAGVCQTQSVSQTSSGPNSPNTSVQNVCGNVGVNGSVAAGNNCNTTVVVVPPSPPKPVATVDDIQEIDTSDFSVRPAITHTVPARAHVRATPGDQLEVTFSCRHGSWPQGSVVYLTSTGSDTVSAPYESPTEVGKDQLEVGVVDMTNGQVSDSAYSNEFDVVAPPPNPGSAQQ